MMHLKMSSATGQLFCLDIGVLNIMIVHLGCCLFVLHVRTLLTCHNVPYLDQNWADAASIGPVMVQECYIMACLQGSAMQITL